MVDGLGRDDELLGDLRVAHSGRDQPEYVELACGEAAGVLAGRRSRPLTQVAHAPAAEAAHDDRGGTPGAQALPLLDGAPDAQPGLRVREGERGLVRAAELGPEPRRVLGLAGEHPRERLRRAD